MIDLKNSGTSRRKNLCDLVRPDQKGIIHCRDHQKEMVFRKIYGHLVDSTVFLKQGRDYEDISDKMLLAIDECETNILVPQEIVRAIGEIAFWLIINGDRSQTADALEKAVLLTKDLMNAESFKSIVKPDAVAAS